MNVPESMASLRSSSLFGSSSENSKDSKLEFSRLLNGLCLATRCTLFGTSSGVEVD